MKQLICQNCGSPLTNRGEDYECRYCGAVYEKDQARDIEQAVSDAIGEYKLESLAKARMALYKATHVRYPEKASVVSAATSVISIYPEDVLSKVYLHSYDGDPTELVKAIVAVSSKAQANEAFNWLIEDMHPRCIGPIKDMISRCLDGKESKEALDRLETQSSKIEEGIFDPLLPRDVFLCYSSNDVAKVIETMDVLESNGFTCWAAFRNLRAGKGAAERYNDEIFKAMKSCRCVLFFSSVSSRSPSCDCIRIELPHLSSDLPNKPRIEYILEDYSKQKVPLLAMRVLKDAFDGLQWVNDESDLLDRISLAKSGKVEPKEKEAFCPNCGKKISESSKFCPDCGHPIAENKKAAEPKKEAPSSSEGGFDMSSFMKSAQDFWQSQGVPSSTQDMVMGQMRSAFDGAKGAISLAPSKNLIITSTSGNITLIRGNSLNISGGTHSIGENIKVTTVSDDVVITLPDGEIKDISIRSVSGDVSIKLAGISIGKIRAEVTSGDVYFDADDFERFDCKSVSGNLTTKKKYDNVFFKSSSGELLRR